MRHVAIIVYPHSPIERSRYWLRAISECWLERGIKVSVVSDPRASIEADIAVLHVDMTVIPPSYLAFARRFAVTLNGSVADISKRAISAHLLGRGEPWDGPVIVKTNRNCYGYPEMSVARKGLESRPRPFAGRYLADLIEKHRRARRHRQDSRARAALEYRVLSSVDDVPEAVWRDDGLVVERFLPERSNGRYCVRTWLFLGDRDRHTIFYSNKPVIKGPDIIDYGPLGDVPEELRQMRRDLKFDFGKFDYTMVDGRPILFDANRTPSFGQFPRERYLPIASSLADGIAAFSRNAAGIGSQHE